MRSRVKTVLFVFSMFLMLVSFKSVTGEARDASWYVPLEKKVLGIIHEYDGTMSIGLSFVDITEDRSFTIRGNEAYPLASVFKVPILVAVMKRVDSRRISMADRIVIHEWDKCIGSGSLLHRSSGTSVTVSECLESMITISDNTATDLLWTLIGNEAVNELMGELNLTKSNIYISNRPGYLISLGLGSEFQGKTPDAITHTWTSKSMKERKKSIAAVLEENKGLSLREFQKIEDESASMQSGSAYYSDAALAEALDNYSSPSDMAQLLCRLYKGQLLSRSSTDYCLGVLARVQYNSRIPGLLPRNVPTYHKTGTICGIVNDMGIIRISRKCPVVLAVFVKNIGEGSSGDASRAIARVSRAIYDYYCKAPLKGAGQAGKKPAMR